MAMYAKNVVAQAQAWLGKNGKDGSHKEIIDVYNSQRPLPRGYKVKYTDAWCATFVSAVAVKLGYTAIIPTECSCPKMIQLLKNIGAWVENDAYVPKGGDLLFYDFDDNGAGDNTGGTDHIGIVEKVEGSTITVIEGNYSNSVKRRTIKVNGRYIRGYGVPKYDAGEADPVKAEPVKYVPTVKEWQLAAIADGFKFPKYGADGEWGAECASVAQKAVVKKRAYWANKNLTRIVQRVVGVEVDGKCGNDTQKAIIDYQRKNGLTADGSVGLNTWKKILGVG